jgi:beta-glucosidase/6-phospho-beta-glucosidase/beta-galactosidase
MGGFECSCQINGRGARLDLIHATRHDLLADSDYALLRQLGMRTVRDGVRWHLIEQDGSYDFSSLEPLLRAADRQGVQVIWDLCHYGWPDDLDIFSAEFIERFTNFSAATARFISRNSSEPPFYIPVNEISFFAWAAGQVGYFHPFERDRGPELKRQLVLATIAATQAIRKVEPRARILTAEPVINVVPRHGEPFGPEVTGQHESQYEAWDMLAGRTEPELGGTEHQLDVIGVNYYHDNQWELPGGQKLPWNPASPDHRWKPFHQMLQDVWRRYQRPLFVSETSHCGAHRAGWLRYVTSEVLQAITLGVPVLGICIYPVLDRPDWDDPERWHQSGIWDLEIGSDGQRRHVLATGYAAELRRSQKLLTRAQALQDPAAKKA